MLDFYAGEGTKGRGRQPFAVSLRGMDWAKKKFSLTQYLGMFGLAPDGEVEMGRVVTLRGQDGNPVVKVG